MNAYGIVAEWIAAQQRVGRICDDDPDRLAVLFLDMLIGERQLGWLTSVPQATRRDKIDETVRLAVKVFLGGCARQSGRGPSRPYEPASMPKSAV
jgi:hypothetical protein